MARAEYQHTSDSMDEQQHFLTSEWQEATRSKSPQEAAMLIEEMVERIAALTIATQILIDKEYENRKTSSKQGN